MRKIFSVFGLTILALSIFGQKHEVKEIMNAYTFLKSCISIPLPFCWSDSSDAEYFFSDIGSEYSFPNLSPTKMALPLMSNLQQTKEIKPPLECDSVHPEIGMQFWSIVGKFPTPSSANFVVAMTRTVAYSNESVGFISLGSNNNLIDQLIGYSHIESPINDDNGFASHVRLREFTIDRDSIITVFSIRSVERERSSNVSDSFRGQRIDLRYKVSAEGHFVEIDKVIYRPQLYRLTDLSSRKFNIRYGKEKRCPTAPISAGKLATDSKMKLILDI